MNSRVITLCYRKLVDANSTKQWEKLVFDDSYLEFKMQAQNFTAGTAYTTYSDLVNNIPNARALPGMVAHAITGYIQQLNGVMPDLLNNIGQRFLRFEKFQLVIINSDINQKEKHHIAIDFYSAPLTWIDTVNSSLLVSYNQPNAEDGTAVEMISHLLQLPPYVNIHTVKNL